MVKYKVLVTYRKYFFPEGSNCLLSGKVLNADESVFDNREQ